MPITTKPRQIKPWPDLVGFYPLLKAPDVINSRAGRIHLNLSSLNSVDAIGFAIFLASTMQTLSKLRGNPVLISYPKKPLVMGHLEALGLRSHLAALGLEEDPTRDLFDATSRDFDNLKPTNFSEGNSKFEHLITIMPSPRQSRDQLLTRIKAEIKSFLQIDKARSFAHEQLMLILSELVKNTLDHSGQLATLGLIFDQKKDGTRTLTFAYCDTGIGICRTVRTFIDDLGSPATLPDEMQQLIRLKQKGGFVDMLHWALQPGNSTKGGNGINFGLGMMLIAEGAKKCGIRLLVKDADSVVELTELASPPSHFEIREKAVKVCASPLLMFHGELEF